MNLTQDTALQYEQYTGQHLGACMIRIWDWAKCRYRLAYCDLIDPSKSDNIDPSLAPLPGEDTTPDPLKQETPTQRVLAYFETHGPSTTAEIGEATGLKLQDVRNVLHKRTQAGKRFCVHDVIDAQNRTGDKRKLKRWTPKETS